MKRNIIFLLLAVISYSLMAKDFTGIKIYVNPGHGGYDGANDRNLVTIPYALNDTLGFWESYSNLRKGLALRDMLEAKGATVIMSRTLNRDQDDRSLSEIAEEANANNVDAFLSIHSNAVGANSGTNYPLLLFHGTDTEPTVAASLPMAQAAWPRMISNKLTVWTAYTTSSNIRGDFSFYGNTSGLGVLRPLIVPGFLSEGSFHDYKPETHRLLNQNYRKLEAANFYKYFCDYFQTDLPATGTIAGFVKGQKEKINNANYVYKTFSEDQWLPLNGTKVKLMNAAGDSLDLCQVDTLYNGIYAFHDLQPGTYKLRFEAVDHEAKDTTVTVTAATTTYAKMWLVNPNLPEEEILYEDYVTPVQEAGMQPMNHYNFSVGNTVNPEWLDTCKIRKVVYRNEKMYVLTKDPKILVVDAKTTQLIREMKTDGVSGGTLALSDINFTADGKLLACNKDSISLPENKNRFFKVYVWENDTVAPSLLFQTQYQGSWLTGVVGETFAVSGPAKKCSIYIPSVTTGTSKAIRIIGLLYEQGQTLGYKYMLDANNYKESVWGENFKFTISPTGKDHLIVDGEKMLPTEFKFDWELADRSAMINKGAFAEKSGYTLETLASGVSFFRSAGHVYMVAPNCKPDATAAGCVLFDITEGINKAVKVSEFLPENGLGTAPATYMTSAGFATGYDLTMMVLAQKQGMARMTTVPVGAVANIYASELSCTSNENGYSFKFTLNENATGVEILISDNNGVVKTINAGSMTKGIQSVLVAYSDLPEEGTYSWSIKAVAVPVDRPVKISDNSKPQMQFYSPRGVAVDNSFNSPFFGRVYASETAPGTVTNRTTKDGVYVLNSALEDVTNQGAASYAGGVTWGAGSSPMRLAVAEDGKVFITDWSDTHSGVWVMDPANPSATFVPVFSGLTRAATGLSSINGVNVHGSIAHCWVLGTKEDTRLYTFDEDYVDATATSTGNVLQYNIGTLSTPWQQAPSKVVYNDALNGNLQQNMNSCIAPDGRQGWWISQYRGEDAANIPSLIHIGVDGMVDFNSGKTPLLIENSYTGGMAVSYDGKRLAMGCKDEVKIFDVSFNEKGIPVLTRLHSIKPAMGANTAGLSIDRSGNVYVISNTSERLGVWALPKADNSFITPAPEQYKLNLVKTGLVNEKKEIDIRLYPNPMIDNLIIDSEKEEILGVEIYDMNGRLILQDKPYSMHVKLNVDGLQRGFYLVKVQTENSDYKQKMIKK